MRKPTLPTTRATIDDVALRAGVSAATVSRALRGLPNVAPATRTRVLGVAEELHYYPDPHASRLAAGRTRTVGVAVPYIGQWYFSQVIAGAEAILSEAGYDLLVYGADSPTDRQRFVSEALPMRNRVDGIILVDLLLPPDEAAAWAGAGVHLVTIGQRGEMFSSVTVDERAAAAAAVHHLLNLGHRAIGLIEGPEDDPFRFTIPRDRRQGYEDTLTAHGIPVRPELCVPGDFTAGGGAEAMTRLLSMSGPPTAVFALSDEMAMGAVRAVRDHGMRVPEDVSIIGFDDHDLAQAFGLTTMRQPVTAHGMRAARLLLASLGESPAGPVHETVPTSLVVRGSTRPVRDPEPGDPA